MGVPAAGEVPVQVFGRRDSRQTQRALRFFRERGMPLAFVDLAVRPIAPTELRRFAQRLGVEALIDRDGRRYRDLGLGYMRLDDAEILERLRADPGLLRLPLVRRGEAYVVGADEAAWKALLVH
jgi:arsenate reductase-like glutaredoxin family protein